jgi:hypothetical protein
MEFNYTIEEWTISKLLNYLENGKFTKLPHQRPLTLKKNSDNRFIDSALNNDLLIPFIFADLKTSLECSNNKEERDFFESYLNRGKELSIEDCQHRMASLESITDDNFVNKFEGRKQDFLNSKVYVGLIKYATKSELSRKFGKVNSGKTVSSDNLIWGIDNTFNNFIKHKFIGDEKLLRLYNVKNKSESVERILYGNIIKMIKVCSGKDGIVSSCDTGAELMMSFVKSDIDINKLIDIIGLFDFWYEHIKSVPDKKSFKTQSNLFFIIHIMNKNNIKLDKDKINNILSKLVDSRKSAETRYNYILSIIKNEK